MEPSNFPTPFAQMRKSRKKLVNVFAEQITSLRRCYSALNTRKSLGNTTATATKTCSSTTAFLLEDKDDYKLYSLEHSSTPWS